LIAVGPVKIQPKKELLADPLQYTVAIVDMPAADVVKEHPSNKQSELANLFNGAGVVFPLHSNNIT
jgi:hypothetical protein